MMANAAGQPLPWRAGQSCYVFARKRDFDAAVETLHANGFIS